MSLVIESGGYTLTLADGELVTEAQRLRHDVFAAEYGTQLPTLRNGLDADEYDPHSDHLVVRHDASDTIVGTYRMMSAACAAVVGRRYGERTFDLAPLRPLDAGLVETGRAAVHPEHRNGAVIGLMWAGIARYLSMTGRNWLGGCAWVPGGADAGERAAGIWAATRDKHLAPPEFRVEPRHRAALKEIPAPLLRRVKPQLTGVKSVPLEYDHRPSGQDRGRGRARRRRPGRDRHPRS